MKENQKIDKGTKKSLLFLILFIGLLLRFSGLKNISLSGDFKSDWETAGRIVDRQELPFFGPSTSINQNLKMGPGYFYLMAGLHFLSGGNYKLGIIYFSLLNTLSIWLLFRVIEKYFGQRVAFISCSVLAVSKYAVEFGNYPWNSYFIPFFISLILYCLFKIRENSKYILLFRQKQTCLFFLSLGVFVQLHFTTWLIVPIFLTLFWRARRHGRRDLIIALFIFISTLFPYILGVIKDNFSIIKEVGNVFVNVQKEICVFSDWLKNHGHGESCFHFIRNPLFILRFFAYSLLGNKSLLVLMIPGVLIGYFLFKIKTSFKKIISFWLLLPFLIFLIYSKNVYLHYFLIYFPLPYLIFALFLDDVEKRFKREKFFSRLMLIMVLGVNILGNYQLMIQTR